VSSSTREDGYKAGGSVDHEGRRKEEGGEVKRIESYLYEENWGVKKWVAQSGGKGKGTFLSGACFSGNSRC